MDLFTTGGHCLNLMKKEEFRLINRPGILLPYEISNRGRVRYVLPTGECVYITAKDDGLGDKYVKLQTMLSVEPVLFSVNLLIKETFCK